MIVSLTFDDGLVKHLEVARILYKMDVQASFYLITGLKEYGGKPLLAKEPRLVREVYDMGHEVASHTVTHRDLTTLTMREVEEECVGSKEFLEDVVSDEVKGISYPYGAYNGPVVDVVKRYYLYGRTMGGVNRWNEALDPYSVGSTGLRHLIKLPLKLLASDVRLTVLAFHDEGPRLISSVTRALKDLGFEVLPLYHALKKLTNV
ncbi:MAG: polysaccharide deacetylase family protein [Candidatus Nezhaarchaeota archaeon]|nr:polysaccharide deacetylase family protein [Candidatus Nezhaarchaeota archaeon]